MSQKTTRYVLATVLVGILLGAAIAGPTFSAYADRDNSKGKSQDGKKNHQKDREGDDKGDKERCENGASAKYNKHCGENDDHEKDKGKGGDKGKDKNSSKGKGHSKGKED